MKLSQLAELYARHPRVAQLAQFLSSKKPHLTLGGTAGSSAALAFASLALRGDTSGERPIVIVMDDDEEAGYFYHDLVQILGEAHTFYLPSSYKRAIKFGQRDAGNEIMRTEALTQVAAREAHFVVTTPQSLAEQVVTHEELDHQTISIAAGTQLDQSFLKECLLELGFKRTDYVYEPGQFAVRGSIVDVYSYSCEEPYRIDFFGDDIDSIRTFDVNTQLSTARLERVSIVPEVAATQTGRQTFLQFLPTGSILVTHSVALLCQSIAQIAAEGFTEQAIEAEGALNAAQVIVDADAFRTQAEKFRTITLQRGDAQAAGIDIAFATHAQPAYGKNFDLLIESFQQFRKQHFRLYILANSTKQNERLRQILIDKEAHVECIPIEGTLHAGFIDDEMQACLFTDHQIFERFHKFNLKSERARVGRVALTLKELQQFRLGDYVVHIDHGIGRFCGLVRVPDGDKMQEMIKLEYNRGDVVFVSIHSLHKVSRYKGREGEQPRISTLGTGAWDKMKERTKKKIKDIARDLILLYSKRREEKGFAFSPDSFMQRELEGSFRYEDTPDQLKTTQDVKHDMESPRPMDRLVCGDVGFGKTEIAIRAAFKACADGKQVAVLVPTTVLAWQHFRAFSERLKQMPVRVEYLSRARTTAQTNAILKDLAAGKVDIIIGTHKLIGKAVRFKDLGLLVIDEEQKFGVSTKEKLRQMRTNVDTLTLTATPIPRTLQFSLMGARDLSVIQTPPPNRRPIHTRIATFTADAIAEAVQFEMSRNGQVYLVSNRIATLPDLAQMVRRNVPDARVAVGHGQMPPEELEKIMVDFANQEYDVLVSTTIIESGIDIPNANTIIINGAHQFGLCDLHQMRGRVGRSDRKAFCYLLAPPLASLPDESRRRLQAIEDYSDLGSGIHIAMQDLDIRGAGNLLGAEQSGFIADLGYETYKKILSQAVKELRESEFANLYADDEAGKNKLLVDECQFETDLQIAFSETYVPTAPERMMLYRELDGLEDKKQIEDFCTRMQDRFGPIPSEGMELVHVVELRQMARHLGIERIVLKHDTLRLYFPSGENHPFYSSEAFNKIINFATTYARRCKLSEVKGANTLLIHHISSAAQALEMMERINANQ